MAEPTPGNPGGSGAPRSGTAATFVVNDRSLRDLSKTWRDLTKDVTDFGKAVGELKRHQGDLDSLHAKLQRLGVGGGTGRPGSGTGQPGGGNAGRGGAGAGGTPPPSGGAGAGSAGRGGAGAGGTPPPSGRPSGGGGGGGGGGGLLGSFGQRTDVRIAGGFVAASSAYFGPRMGDISDNDLLFNQLGRAQGGSYSNSRMAQERQAILDVGGFQSGADLNAGVRTATGALGGTATTGRGAGLLRQSAQLTSLDPSMGLGQTSQATASMYTAASSNRLRGATGQGAFAVGGAAQSPTVIYDRVLKAAFGGQSFTAQDITEGMVDGAPLQRTLNYLLPDPGAQQLFRAYALARVSVAGKGGRTNTAKNASDAGRAVNAAQRMTSGLQVSNKDEDLVKKAGLRDNIRSAQNRASEQSTENSTELGAAARGGLMMGFESLADVTQTVTDTLLDLNGALLGSPMFGAGFASSFASPVASALGAAGGVMGATMGIQSIQQLFGGRRRNAGSGGPGAGGGADGASGDEQRVFVTNWPDCICDGGGGGGGGRGGRRGSRRVAGSRRRGAGAGAADEVFDEVVDEATDPPRRRGLRGALGRARALGPMARVGAGAGVGAGAFGGLSLLGNHLENEYGDRNEKGERSAVDRLGNAGFTVGKYAASGAAAGAVIGGPVGAIVGGVAGTAAGSVKSIYDWYWGDNKKKIGGEPTAGAPAPGPTPGFWSANATEGGVPRMSAGGVIKGSHTNDDVAILATPGELVVPLAVTSRYGGARKLMKMLGFEGNELGGDQQGDNRHFAKGGEVSGMLKDSELVGITGGGRLRADAAAAFNRMVAETKRVISVTDSYRSYAAQVAVKRAKPGLAAKPGTSNHGWGLALDLGGGINRFGTAEHKWMQENGPKYGWIHPAWARQGGSKPEAWHWEYGPGTGQSGGGPGAASTGQAASNTGNGDDPSASGSAIVAVAGNGSASSELEALAGILSGGSGGAMGVVAAQGASSAGGAATTPTSDTASGAAPTAGGAPADPSGNVKLGQQRAAARGWTGGEWDSLYQLWQKESGWNHQAANPKSSARGIPQAMMSLAFGKGWEKNGDAKAFLNSPDKQIDWGLNYIAGRYKMPSKAWAHSQKLGWYDSGAWSVANDEVAQLHAGEMVMPKRNADQLRAMVRDQQGTAPAPSGSQGTPTNRSVTLHIQAPVTVVGKATQADARQFLEMVKDEAERNNTLDMIGAG